MSLLRLIADRFRGRETVTTVELLGCSIRIAMESRNELRRARSLSAEHVLLVRMLEHLAPGDIVYDVGANIGLIGLLLATASPSRIRRVHSFEPEPINFRRLSRNIEINRMTDRIVPHRLALAAEPGEATLFVRGGAGEGRHSLASAKGSKSSIRVPVTTVSRFARDSGEPPTFLKIDVEGAEGRVLEGMEPLLAASRPRELFVEIHPRGDGDVMPGGESIGDWLAAHGYALAWELRHRSRVQRHYR